jgi:hypothetical protein
VAQLLVMDRDNTHADPKKDRRGCYKRGMVVEVFEDSKRLAQPQPHPFVLVKIDGMTKAEAEKYLQPETVTKAEFDAKGAVVTDAPELYRRRAFVMLLDELPVGSKDALSKDRICATTAAVAKPCIQHITTGVKEK